nr:DUF3034 family protein [Pseudomonadota bacterium]
MQRAALLIALAATLPWAGAALASERRDGGKLLLTAGVSSVEGAAGGGLASWALIGGDETEDGIGGSVHATYVALPDFDLTSVGAAIGYKDRIELSYAHQRFDTRAAGAALGLGQSFTFGQDVFGAKLRVAGDAVWDQGSILPQIAIGVQHKRATKGAIIRAIGGRESAGTDFYASATKVVLARSLVLDATLRLTKANQFGLLGFGGDRQGHRTAQFEGSAGMLVTHNVLLGGEYRTKPDNLGFAREDDTYDLFAAWAVGHHVAVTAAYTDLGAIATIRNQHGLFLSL